MVGIGFGDFIQRHLKFLLNQIFGEHIKIGVLPKYFTQMCFKAVYIVFDFKRQGKNLLMHLLGFQMHVQDHLLHVAVVLLRHPSAFAGNLLNLV